VACGYVTISLQANAQFIGIIGLFSPFTDWLEAISQSTLSHIRMVMAQLYAQNQLHVQITRLQLLNQEISTITNTNVDQDFFTHVCRSAQRIFDATNVLFAHFQPEMANFVITDTNGMLIGTAPISIVESVCLQAPKRHIITQTPLPTIFTHLPQFVSFGNHNQTEVIISVPMQRNNTLFGVLILTHVHHEFLTQQDVTYAAQFAEFVTSHYHQQQLANALNESERRYRFLINESSNPIFVINTNDVVIHMNHAARRLIGSIATIYCFLDHFF
jgi:PAS domain-containing protein